MVVVAEGGERWRWPRETVPRELLGRKSVARVCGGQRLGGRRGLAPRHGVWDQGRVSRMRHEGSVLRRACSAQSTGRRTDRPCRSPGAVC